MSEFNGFYKETSKFFEDLKKNNTKEWFNDHKRDYQENVLDPAIPFVTAMGQRLRKIAPSIVAIPRINKSLFRLNRDTRFSNDKSPYKTNLGIWFWEGPRKRMECSGFYFHLEPNRLMLGAGLHIFTKDLLNRYREVVVDKKHGADLRKAIHSVSEKGYIVHGKYYKKIPAGYDPSHKNAEYLLYNGLSAMVETKIPREFFSSALIDYVFSHFKNMSPIQKWLRKALG